LFDRQERQELENRISLIQSKQRQLEAQEKVISEALTFTPQSAAELVTSGLKSDGEGHISDSVPRHVLDMTLGHREYPITSEYPGVRTRSRADTDVILPKPVLSLPHSSHSGTDTDVVVPLSSQHGVGRPVVSHRGKSSSVDSHTARVREYQDELLQRQTDRQYAVIEARRRLQIRAEQLLDSGLNLFCESSNNEDRAASHSQPLAVLCGEAVESYRTRQLSRNDISHVTSSDVLQAQVVSTKPYIPELYKPESLSEDVEPCEYSAAVSGPREDDGSDGERQFVTPELRYDDRVRPCRVAEYSLSPSSLHASDAAACRGQQPVTSAASHSNMQAGVDDFSSLIVQAQRDLEVRQRQMQDQLEELENEERRLAEQQLRMTSQLSSFPQTIQTFTDSSHSQQQTTTVPDPSILSSSDLLAPVATRVSPSVLAQNMPVVSREDSRRDLSPSKDSLVEAGPRSGQQEEMTLDDTLVESESHEIHVHLSPSAPLLQSHDGNSIHSDQLLHSIQLPVSILFRLFNTPCLKKK